MSVRFFGSPGTHSRRPPHTFFEDLEKEWRDTLPGVVRCTPYIEAVVQRNFVSEPRFMFRLEIETLLNGWIKARSLYEITEEGLQLISNYSPVIDDHLDYLVSKVLETEGDKQRTLISPQAQFLDRAQIEIRGLLERLMDASDSDLAREELIATLDEEKITYGTFLFVLSVYTSTKAREKRIATITE